LLNGISSEELVGGIIGSEHMLYAYGVGMDAVREGGTIRYSNMGRIVFGERENTVVSARVGAVRRLLEEAGIPFVIPQNMIRALWSKFMLNVGINQASAVLRSPYSAFQRDREARELMVMAASEVVAISKRNGIDLGEKDLAEFLKIIDGLDPSGKTSMLQDIEAGRKTEVDIYSGRVIELGAQLDVPTPVNEVLFRIISVMERATEPRQRAAATNCSLNIGRQDRE
ncbi:MAG TPA: ketopantoate reductase C-terminal domain-containing protein, partial [Spirochaetia bacterium]|nr:ketopantoate reductase C-terminal domain-containing protein [Spirochaetia bacterium]